MKQVSLVLVVLVLMPYLSTAAPREVVEGIAVRVNDRIVTVSEMRLRLSERRNETGRDLTPEQLIAVLDDTADELCLLERATELKIDVTSEDVTRAVQQLREDNRVADDAQFDEMLKASGMTRERLRQRIRDTLTVNYVLSREVGNVPITEEELRQRYNRDREYFRMPEKAHLYHVVFNLNADRSDLDQRMQDARRFVAAARAGSDFLVLTEEEMRRGGATGGDLGVLALTDLRSEVLEAVSSLKVGETSEPFASPAGIHVVSLVERIPAGYRPFEDVIEEVREQEMGQRYRAKLDEIVERLKKRFVVETFPELLQ